MASQTRAGRNPRPPIRLADEQRAESRNEVERRRARRQARGVPAPPPGQANAEEANEADDNAERQNREEEEEEQGRDDADDEHGGGGEEEGEGILIRGERIVRGVAGGERGELADRLDPEVPLIRMEVAGLILINWGHGSAP